jgi:mycothiol synthase
VLVLYRHYQGGDEEDLVACWNRALPKDQISLSRLVSTTLLDQNFSELGLIEARDGTGELRGFVHAVTAGEGGDGWVTALVVDPASRRQGVGRALLGQAEEFLSEKGCTRALVSPYAPGYYYPGVFLGRYPGSPELFEACGYRRVASVVAMDLLLADYEVPENAAQRKARLEAEGWRFGPATVGWYTRLVSFCSTFSDDWAAVVRAALRGGAGEQALVATLGEQVGGFAIYGAFRGSLDRFGPFGVAPELRGQGIGNVLLHATLKEMASRGLHCAWFLWTGEQDAAFRLYEKAGFSVTRRFGIYERRLDRAGGLASPRDPG